MLSTTLIRSLQGMIAQLSFYSGDVNKEIRDLGALRNEQPAEARLVDVRMDTGLETKGLVFRYSSDPTHASRLVLSRNKRPSRALHLEMTPDEARPLLVGLHYIHSTRRRAAVAHYFMVGALATHDDPKFEYSRIMRRETRIEALAELIYNLNLPVAGLPYPAGRKLAMLSCFKRMNIRYVGDILKRDPANLKAQLGPLQWTTLQSMLRGLHLQPGTPIPHWKPPR